MKTEEFVTQFLTLAIMYIHEEKSIDFYAEKMNMNAVELNALMYDINKKEFNEWIEWITACM